ncbi:hypothetical protein O53_1885 [Microcystis aeruginosa TAIHU98]|uniref:Uncharacterized protein n=1 Tax=Microcystis aeruginosa TAIHU98 TaxID=1134457 RepID=L7EG72_MICAE|nr:hypothetical protein O53_1885 [Microcystis aeruginosa TAIHU98]
MDREGAWGIFYSVSSEEPNVLDKLNYKQSNVIDNLIYLILFLALKYMIAMIV